MDKALFTFRHPLRVRWAEVDRQGVVFNPQYFAYFDVAVTEYWRALGVRYPEDFAQGGTDTFAVSAHAEFHESARYDELLDLCCRVARIGRASMKFVFALYRGDRALTTGEIVYVNATVAERRASPWPQPIQDAIVRFEKTAPEIATPRVPGPSGPSA